MAVFVADTTPEGDEQTCRALLRDGSRTFHAASKVLPPRVRRPAVALYAFCRVADDAVDRTDAPDQALRTLHERLDRIYEQRPLPMPADRAFARTAAAYAIPKALPAALLEGFAWDAAGRRYETLSDLHAYAARVAGSVGVMMTLLMGVREPCVLARACDLGIAMQLTNIARDVGEDARAGRLYLPRSWLRAEGIEADEWLRAPVYDQRLGRVVQRLLDAADTYYERASGGIGSLPVSCRAGIHAARLLYAEIGREVERRGLDSVSQRAVVPWSRKLARLAAAVADAIRTPAGDAAHTVPEGQFLIDAVAAAPAAPPRGEPRTRRGFDGQVEWLVDLFERLERRDQALRGRA